MPDRLAVIIGAGPAGLTAAYELLHRTDLRPVVFESSGELGGLARTVNYRGNRIDIGGHRFFSKSDRVMRWWQNILPLQGATARDGSCHVSYQGQQRPIELSPSGPDPELQDRVMLVRRRRSRILFLRRFFEYPLRLSLDTIRGLGWARLFKVALSYARVCVFPRRSEKTLEDFLINRFGRQLYRLFFESYTEKVWGVPCRSIPSAWGAQRVKGLSISRAIAHAVRRALSRLGSSETAIRQHQTETSLIERFLYPKFGPGQMWQETARIVTEKGGLIHLNQKVVGICRKGRRITAVQVEDFTSKTRTEHPADFFFSSMPIQELIACMRPAAPPEVIAVARGLVYRDFITVGLLLKRLRAESGGSPSCPPGLMPDNWIYVQEPDVKVGRLQIYNNWSPYLVRDPDTIWMGLEYFVNEGDEFWHLPDAEMIELAVSEMEKLGLVDRGDFLDAVVIRMPKAYPAYFGSYDRFGVIRSFVDRFENLFLIGRNGMHRYNNQDHSMLAAMIAVDNIVHGVTDKENIWSVNTEADYQEERRS